MQENDETPQADELAAPIKASAWTDEERERAAAATAEAVAAPTATDLDADAPVKAPAWLKRLAPGTTVKHQGVVCTVIHIGYAGGRFMVLMEPLGLESTSAGQRRARFDELKRQGIGKKEAKRRVRAEFAVQGDETELPEAVDEEQGA